MSDWVSLCNFAPNLYKENTKPSKDITQLGRQINIHPADTIAKQVQGIAINQDGLNMSKSLFFYPFNFKSRALPLLLLLIFRINLPFSKPLDL